MLIDYVDDLRKVFAQVKEEQPFNIDAIGILPEHLHTIWTLPEGDSDFSNRWQKIKGGFSKLMPEGERLSESRKSKGKRGIWQRRFWEHVIRDELDYERHVDHIHYNPVKHGYCKRVKDWPNSSFYRYVDQGVYTKNWGRRFGFC